MNLNAIAAGITRSVSPPIAGTLRYPVGIATWPDGKVMQVYLDQPVTLDVQALTGRALMHTQAMNLQGIVKSVYCNTNIRGMDRQDGVGGDVLTFDDGDGAADWIASTVVERWPTGWCHVAATKQAINGVKVYIERPDPDPEEPPIAGPDYVLNDTGYALDMSRVEISIWPSPQ